MADAEDHAPELQPSEIAEHAFSTSRRGYDQAEVRAFLGQVADAHRALLARAAAAETQAAEIVGAAEARAAEVVREAQEEAERLLATVAEERHRGFEAGGAEAAAVVAEAEANRRRIEAEAQQEAERLVAEAEAARAKVLRDLRRRRKTARTHLEQLQAARERLLAALAEVRAQIETTTAGLRDALPEAKVAADAAARRVAAEQDVTVEQLEGEIEALRLAGLPLLSADDPSGEVPAVGAGASAASERRSEAVRIVRPIRAQDPVTGLPEEELRPIEAPHPDEAVRLVTVEELAEADVDGVDVVVEVAPEVEVVPEVEAEVEAEDAPDVGAEVVPEVVPDVDDAATAADDPVDVVAEAPAEPGRPNDEADVAEEDAPAEVDVAEEVVPSEVEAAAAAASATNGVDAAEVGAEEPAEPERSAAGAGAGARPPAEAVDALFARLKSGRADRVTAAEKVLARGDEPAAAEPAADDEPARAPADADVPVTNGVHHANGTAQPAAEVPPADPVAADAEARLLVHRGGGADREALLARRDEAIAPPLASLARRLKRVLADEQNEVLDGIRRRGPAAALASVGEHGARWAAEASVDLAAAATAGAAYVDPDGPAGVDPTPGDLVEVAEAFAMHFAAPLHHRLEELLAASDDDADLASDSVRAVYRAWKAERLPAAVEHAVLDAFAAGVAGRCPTGTPVCWVVDDGGMPCPDAEDNALAGELPCGEPFPTGHVRPPAHPGCRCVVVPVSIIG